MLLGDLYTCSYSPTRSTIACSSVGVHIYVVYSLSVHEYVLRVHVLHVLKDRRIPSVYAPDITRTRAMSRVCPTPYMMRYTDWEEVNGISVLLQHKSMYYIITSIICSCYTSTRGLLQISC